MLDHGGQRYFILNTLLNILKRSWGLLLFAGLFWLAFLSEENAYVQVIRSKIAPVTCSIMPANVLLLPLLYGAIVVAYAVAKRKPGVRLGAAIKDGLVQILRNIVADNPSQAIAASAAFVVFVMMYWCATLGGGV